MKDGKYYDLLSTADFQLLFATNPYQMAYKV